jgi:hypothetical protein
MEETLMNRHSIFAMLAACAAVLVGPSAMGQPIFSESFPVDGPFTSAAYPEWTFVSDLPAVTANVVSGVLTVQGIADGARASVVIPSLSNVTISATVSSTDHGFGLGNVGLRWGDLDFVFHPGFPGGAFRIDENAGANSIVGNTNMGFTPISGRDYRISVHGQATGSNTDFDVVITDGSNTFAPSTFTIPNSKIEDFTLVGLLLANNGIKRFDNFLVTPEPSSLLLCLFGMSVLGFMRRGRKKAGAR